MAGEIFEEELTADPLQEGPAAPPPVGKVWKILGGIGAFLPLAGYILFLLWLIPNGSTVMAKQQFGSPPGSEVNLPLVILLGIVWVIAVYGTMGAFIFHAIQNKRFKTEHKVLWGLGLFLGNMLVYPFYWYHHLLHESKRMGEMPNKREQIGIGILSALPLVLIIFIVVFLVGYVATHPDTPTPEVWITIWAIGFTFSFFPAWIYQMIHVFRNPNLQKSSGKTVWFLLIFFTGWLVLPIYWGVHILAKKEKEVKPPPPGQYDPTTSIHNYLDSRQDG